MASTCPNCGKKLRIWDVKAECSSCGVSIPNYNWQARLEEDNIKAEKQFAVFNRTMNRIAYSIYGTKLRIVRLILTFLPAIGFILPWATLKSDGESFDLSIISFSGKKSLIDFFSSFFGDINLYITNMKFEGFGGAVTLGVAGYILFVLSALFIVIAFFLNIIMCKKPKTKSTIVFDALSVAASVAAVVCFVMSGSLAQQFTAFNFGDFPVINGGASVSWGYFVAIVLLFAATGINIAVAKARFICKSFHNRLLRYVVWKAAGCGLCINLSHLPPSVHMQAAKIPLFVPVCQGFGRRPLLFWYF